MDETFLYNKSMEERLEDYSDILQSGNRILPASKVKNEWCFYLELVIDRAGWQALWKIPRDQCKNHDIAFPNVVIVYVEDINFRHLTAQIKVLAVKNDIHLPDSISANLVDLYPTIEQDTSIALDMPLTAENLDIFRFFYHNIWMPWDNDQDECVDWPSQHLDSRIRLYFDLKSGLVPKSTAMKIKNLIAEGRAIVDRYQKVEEEVSDSETIDGAPSSKDVCELAKLHLRLIQVRSEFDMFENADIREALIKQHKQDSNSIQKRNWLIMPSTKTVGDHIQYLKKYEELHSTESVPHIAASLSDACKMSEQSDIIYLSNGKYIINSLEDLENGGKIIGLFDGLNTIISDETSSTPTFLSMFGTRLVIENVTFLFENISTGFSFRKGSIHIKNCYIESVKKPSSLQAIVVHPGAEVTLENCRIEGFDLAIVCKPGGCLNITDSIISRNNSGLVVYDQSYVHVAGTTISQCNYGICVESTGDSPRTLQSNEFENMFPKIKLSGTVLHENMKGDYRIIRKMKSIKEIKPCQAEIQSNLCELMECVDDNKSNTTTSTDLE